MGLIQIRTHELSYQVRDKHKIYRWIRGVARQEKFRIGELSIIICSDEFLLEMNRGFLRHDYYTDIITFDYSEGQIISGELYISLDRVRDNSLELDISLRDELHRVIIHGVLHLCGYKDKTKKDREKMRNRENEALNFRRF